MFALKNNSVRLTDHDHDLIRDLRALPQEDYEAVITWLKTGKSPSFTAPLFSFCYKHVGEFLKPTVSESL